MKTRLCQIFVLCAMFAASLAAQEGTPGMPPEQLDQLLGPIALYPDALIALILPAATMPSDVVLAARYLQNNGDPARTDDQPWDDSVKALSHYPDLIKWMDENLAWTQQTGEAFRDQPAEVMNTVQRLRAEARAAGTLTDTPQQQIIVEGRNLSIMPAQPDVIYVPDYDPDVVYVSHPGYYSDPFLTFGVGYPTGFWLGYNFDWGRRRIWTIDPRERVSYWRDHRDWRHPVSPGRPGYAGDPNPHFWQPRPAPPQPRPMVNNRQRPDIVRPAPFPNASPRPPASHRNASERPPDNHGQPPSSTGRDFAPDQRPTNPPAVPPQRAPAPQPAVQASPSSTQYQARPTPPTTPPSQPPDKRGQPPSSTGRDFAPNQRPAPPPDQPSPSIRQGAPPREPAGRNEEENRGRNSRDETANPPPNKAAAPQPPPAAASPPQATPAQHQARPTPPAAPPSQPPPKEANDNKGNKDDQRQPEDRQKN